MPISENEMKVYQLKAQIIQAAGHPIRLAVIEYLADGEQCVCDIVEHVGAQRSNVSRHLNTMLQAGVLTCRKDGLKVIYKLSMPCIANFIGCVETALKDRLAHQNELLNKM